MRQNEKIEFLVVGAQKAGTSSLHDHLRQVPGLSMPEKKELHFFDCETIDWKDPDYRAYHDRFPEREGMRGEVTPIYSYWPDSLERIARYQPGMKIIVLLRDPVARALSHWRMEYARGSDRVPFAAAIRACRERVTADAASKAGHHRVYSYVERGFYAAQLRRCIALFGHDRVLTIFSRDLRLAPLATMLRIGDFLGVDIPLVSTVSRVINVAPQIDYGADPTDEDRAHLSALFASDQNDLIELSGCGTPFEHLLVPMMAESRGDRDAVDSHLLAM
jgi:hypothetical protein